MAKLQKGWALVGASPGICRPIGRQSLRHKIAEAPIATFHAVVSDRKGTKKVDLRTAQRHGVWDLTRSGSFRGLPGLLRERMDQQRAEFRNRDKHEPEGRILPICEESLSIADNYPLLNEILHKRWPENPAEEPNLNTSVADEILKIVQREEKNFHDLSG
ncbi:hypothetical protein ELI49_30300 (plasmid) [Rhizobium ruizarguesonis]|uniref:hypothetical protein n=1 Tax=Rhizobium ruizarguesonis TaxID=2081791 RepID=UPI00037001EA|nr:hypothetical protein [Rhizobium ruizarguesonis]TAT97615.1 hypothetical protein ELI49_30300 [Rhizobium ruizarguesonis]